MFLQLFRQRHCHIVILAIQQVISILKFAQVDFLRNIKKFEFWTIFVTIVYLLNFIVVHFIILFSYVPYYLNTNINKERK